MALPESLLRLLRFTDELHERVERTWWGVVCSDSRFPLVWDANYAAVDAAAPDLSLAEVEAVLHPALEAAGATHEHVWVMEPERAGRLVEDLGDGGRALGWDTLMVHRGGTVPEPVHAVREVRKPDEAFWERERLALGAFGITQPWELEQVLARHREVLLPAGKRWFESVVDGVVAGIGSVLVHGDAAYVDDVVTMPAFRRRGVARSVMAALLAAAAEAGAREACLFADQPGPIRLYESLGFDAAGEVVTSLVPLRDVAGQRRAAPSGRPASRRSAAEPSSGSGPGRPR